MILREQLLFPVLLLPAAAATDLPPLQVDPAELSLFTLERSAQLAKRLPALKAAQIPKAPPCHFSPITRSSPPDITPHEHALSQMNARPTNYAIAIDLPTLSALNARTLPLSPPKSGPILSFEPCINHTKNQKTFHFSRLSIHLDTVQTRRLKDQVKLHSLIASGERGRINNYSAPHLTVELKRSLRSYPEIAASNRAPKLTLPSATPKMHLPPIASLSPLQSAAAVTNLTALRGAPLEAPNPSTESGCIASFPLGQLILTESSFRTSVAKMAMDQEILPLTGAPIFAGVKREVKSLPLIASGARPDLDGLTLYQVIIEEGEPLFTTPYDLPSLPYHLEIYATFEDPFEPELRPNLSMLFNLARRAPLVNPKNELLFTSEVELPEVRSRLKSPSLEKALASSTPEPLLLPREPLPPAPAPLLDFAAPLPPPLNSLAIEKVTSPFALHSIEPTHFFPHASTLPTSQLIAPLAPVTSAASPSAPKLSEVAPAEINFATHLSKKTPCAVTLDAIDYDYQDLEISSSQFHLQSSSVQRDLPKAELPSLSQLNIASPAIHVPIAADSPIRPVEPWPVAANLTLPPSAKPALNLDSETRSTCIPVDHCSLIVGEETVGSDLPRSREINSRERKTQYELAQLASLNDLSAPSLSDDFDVKIKRAGRSLFSIQLKARGDTALPIMPHRITFIIDISTATDSVRLASYKQAIVSAIKMLGKNCSYEIALWQGDIELIEPLRAPSHNSFKQTERTLQRVALTSKAPSIHKLSDFLHHLEQRAEKEESTLHTAILLSQHAQPKSLRISAPLLKKTCDNAPQNFVLHTTAVGSASSEGYLELLARLHRGDLITASTSSAFPRRFASFVSRIQAPLFCKASLSFSKRTPLECSMPTVCYKHRPFTLYATANGLDSLDLMLQIKADHHFHIRKHLNLEESSPGKEKLVREMDLAKGMQHMRSFLRTSSEQELASAKRLFSSAELWVE